MLKTIPLPLPASSHTLFWSATGLIGAMGHPCPCDRDPLTNLWNRRAGHGPAPVPTPCPWHGDHRTVLSASPGALGTPGLFKETSSQRQYKQSRNDKYNTTTANNNPINLSPVLGSATSFSPHGSVSHEPPPRGRKVTNERSHLLRGPSMSGSELGLPWSPDAQTPATMSTPGGTEPSPHSLGICMAASSGEPQAREIPVPSNCVEGRESYLTLSLEWQEKARLMVMPHAPHWRLFRGKGYFFGGGQGLFLTSWRETARPGNRDAAFDAGVPPVISPVGFLTG